MALDIALIQILSNKVDEERLRDVAN